ncbi:Vacuolar protein sorting-associated protein 51 [Neolecta irregularis DAH-3]|uniref:Vacuolar protein sorting-associated protein 51 homolog n=1 Tax=Neolecta irregularis (strain DAH-3) TaxID=1198029 RepID=A0A1U7LIN6_NEOID|nr:Vacuolar protein sorting-associated protein 51 [Neolecta irregularis DAH-3]|eukprot:OLL22488.1 Vacuolar protein sorting-associated protein 51 [Neolecta irregularis DAH-3]
MSVPASPSSILSRPISHSPSSPPSFSLTSPFQSPPPSLSLTPHTSKRATRNLALRRFYGLDSATASSTSNGTSPSIPAIPGIDSEDFYASKFVDDFLARASLHELIRTENDLIAEIKTIDGERKALVYDNYSKLIAATDTIQRMRSNLKPLDPETSLLIPTLDNITSLCIALGKKLKQELVFQREHSPEFVLDDAYKHIKTVQWAIDGPLHIQSLVKQERYDQARKEYDKLITNTLDWNAKDITKLRADAKKAIDGIPS